MMTKIVLENAKFKLYNRKFKQSIRHYYEPSVCIIDLRDFNELDNVSIFKKRESKPALILLPPSIVNAGCPESVIMTELPLVENLVCKSFSSKVNPNVSSVTCEDYEFDKTRDFDDGTDKVHSSVRHHHVHLDLINPDAAIPEYFFDDWNVLCLIDADNIDFYIKKFANKVRKMSYIDKDRAVLFPNAFHMELSVQFNKSGEKMHTYFDLPEQITDVEIDLDTYFRHFSIFQSSTLPYVKRVYMYAFTGNDCELSERQREAEIVGRRSLFDITWKAIFPNAELIDVGSIWDEEFCIPVESC
jgi:hypothetical protein